MSKGPRTETVYLFDVKNVSLLQQTSLIFRPVYIEFQSSVYRDTGYLAVPAGIIRRVEPIEDAIKSRSLGGNAWISTAYVV
jgi:hypothetical protein